MSQTTGLGAEAKKSNRKRLGLWSRGFIPKTCGKLCALTGEPNGFRHIPALDEK
jgi:hypothetical protein